MIHNNELLANHKIMQEKIHLYDDVLHYKNNLNLYNKNETRENSVPWSLWEKSLQKAAYEIDHAFRTLTKKSMVAMSDPFYVRDTKKNSNKNDQKIVKRYKKWADKAALDPKLFNLVLDVIVYDKKLNNHYEKELLKKTLELYREINQ
ncbi:MAG: hypothetical protein K1X44_05680 [Alphaproteobacteria bacterium]|nr:hypothetical protein [Alphaproteobacteria bacterium]